MSTPRRISASRLNAIDQCTMKYYLNEICGLPEKVFERTVMGTIAHSILECLVRPKHRAHHDAVVGAQSIYGSAPIKRLASLWQVRARISDTNMADLDSMCMVAINHTNFLDEGAIQSFAPEHEFKMTLSNGVVVKGFIDRMAEFADAFVITDYKSARNKHTKAEVRDSYQSLVYQLYVWRTFGKLASVRYVFLRHGPTARLKDKHLMVTPPATPAQLIGFEQYLEHMGKVVNAFGLPEAHSGFCTDEGFCARVCSYRYPMIYLAVVDKASGATISTHMLDNPPNVGLNQSLDTRSFGGCPKWNRQNEH